jgi:hypothetical protein
MVTFVGDPMSDAAGPCELDIKPQQAETNNLLWP